MRAAILIGTLIIPAMAFAKGNGEWKENHPRRAEVNQRLDNQRKRINQGEKNGTLTHEQARELHQDDRNIRQQEREMAAQNGGHITKTEQRALNQEENAESRKIHQEKHPGQ
jgi:hypothetical protein